MDSRPVDDILADLLALEEEAHAGAETEAGSRGWDPDMLQTHAAPTSTATAASSALTAADTALLADCDALLADVDLLLSEPLAGSQPAAAAGTRPQPARSSTAAAAQDPAMAAATAAVLSECDALLADADLLLADKPPAHTQATVPRALATTHAAATQARAEYHSVTAPPAPTPTAVQLQEEPVLQQQAVAAGAGGVAEGAAHVGSRGPAAHAEEAGPAPLAQGSDAAQAAPASAAAPPAAAVAAASASTPATVPAGAAVTAGPSQPADVDLLLLDLLEQDSGTQPDTSAAAVVIGSSREPQAAGSGLVSGSSGLDELSAAIMAQPEYGRQQQVQLQHEQAHQQEQQEQQQQPEQGYSAGPHKQQEQQQQIPMGSSSSAAGSLSEDSSEDMLGEMLHDMAEVLGVDERVLDTPAASAHTAAAAAAAAVAAAGASELPAAVGSTTGVALNGFTDVPQQQQQVGLVAPTSSSGLHASLSHAGGGVSWQQLSSTGINSSSDELPPHELALQQAWVQEEALVHGDLTDSPPASPQAAAAAPQAAAAAAAAAGHAKRRRLAPLPRLQELLSDALSDWNPAGRPDASGAAMVGGCVLLRLEGLAGLFAAGAAAAGAAGGVDWSQVLTQAMAPHGQLQVVAASGAYLAVGTSSGSTLVFQLPVPQGPGSQGSGSGPQNPTHSTHSMGSGHSTLPGGAAMWQLGGPAGGERGVLGFDPVSSLGFSVVGSTADALWLAVGHVSGALTVWELQKRGPRQVAGIAQHSSRLTFTTFFPGRSTSLLLSGDVRGRCCLHTFSASLLRTNVASRVLIAGEYGPLLGVSHLAAFNMQAAALPAAAVRGSSSSGGGGGGGAGAGDAAAEGVEWPDAATWAMLCEEGGWRVGGGICCLTTPTHTYIARLKPTTGDLVMLFSIPQPLPGPQQEAVPVAAWLPHSRQQGSSHCGCRVSGDTLMPVGVLALGWGSRLVLFEVPLVGDQVSAGEAAAVAATAASVAASTQPGKRPHTPAAAAAASAGRLWQQRGHAALDSLTPEVAITVATQFPLRTCGSWSGGQQQQQQPQQQQQQQQGGSSSTGPPEGSSEERSASLDLQQHQLQMGPSEPLPILGVHWLDSDALAVLCNQGYSSLLLVLGLRRDSSSSNNSDSSSSSSSSSSNSRGTGGSLQQQQQQSGMGPNQAQAVTLQVYEQVEWMDQPVDRGWGSGGPGAGGLTAWGADCGGAVGGSGARLYLLGQQGGVFCGRLMPWSERLKTLQDVRKFKLGLYFALRFYLTMQQQKQQGQQHQRQGHLDSSLGPTTPQAQRGSSSSGGGGGSSGSSGRRLGGGHPRQSLGGFARSEGSGAEPQQLEQWLLSLMLNYATAILADAAAAGANAGVVAAAAARSNGSSSSSRGSNEAPAAAVAAAEACVCACLLLSRTDVLFGRVFQLFAAPQSVAVGGLGALVEILELAVLSDLLQGLAPEVMQALVEHFAGKGQPGRVEACVVHLPIMSLDLNQVILLCERSGLYSALTHVYNQMNDFRRPLLDLLANVAAAPSWEAAAAAAYKLLVYLRCCFRGMAFPPGTGNLPTEPPGVRDVIQATLLGSLLFLNRDDLLREWQQSGAAAAAQVSQQLSEKGPAAGPVLPALCDPHPALQLLLAVDVPAAIAVLAEATSGWDAVETDLRAAAGKPTSELESVLVATQVVVNALVTLLEAGSFQQWQATRPPANGTDSSSSSSNSSSSSGGAVQRAGGADVAMNYIIQLLAVGRVVVRPSFVIKLLQYLVTQAAAAAAAQAATATAAAAGSEMQLHGQGLTTAATAAAAAAAAVEPFEEQFVAIVQVVGVQASGGASQKGAPVGVEATALSPAEAKQVLQLAKQCNMLRAAATVHHLQGNYAAALSCYLALADSQQQQPQTQQPHTQPAAAGVANSSSNSSSRTGPQAVFGYITSHLSSSASSSQAREAFLRCVMQQIVQLVRLNAASTAAVLLQHMPEQQVPVLLSLRPTPDLQFQFLKAAMQQNQTSRRESASGTAATAAAAGGGATAAAAAAAGAESLLERPEVAILYVKLLARFEPAAVLPFLQSHHNYSVAEAIQVCRAAGVHDAEAFLQERLGDLDAALRLYVGSALQANSQLQAAVLDGHVQLLALPPGYWVPGWFDRRAVGALASPRSHHDRGNGSSGSGGSSGSSGVGKQHEQHCWGMEQLVQQLNSVAQMVAGAPHAGSAGHKQQQQDTGRSAAAATAVVDLEQTQERLLAAAANVAATLLHQLDPLTAEITSSSSGSRRQEWAPAALSSSNSADIVDAGNGPAAAAAAAAAALQLPPPLVDLYKSWMADLSPRLRIKGIGAGLGSTAACVAGSAKHGAAGPAALVPSSSCGGSSGSSSNALQGVQQSGLRVPAAPPQLLAAWQALQAAVAFCQRNTRGAGTSSGSGPSAAAAAAGVAVGAAAGSGGGVGSGTGQELWFKLMDVYVANLRGLHVQQQQQQHGPQGQQQQQQQGAQAQQQQQPLPTEQQQQRQELLDGLRRAATGQVPLGELPDLLCTAAAAAARQQLLPGLLRLLLDEVVCSMADHLPLLDIVGRILQQHGSEHFGEFRSTLLGLFGATSYDGAIMAAANRLITGDAFTAVRAAYGLRQLARDIQQQQQQQQQEGGQAAATAAPTAAPRPAASTATMAPVQSALLLGVLGPSNYNTASSSSSRLSSAYSLTQADRDLIQGILASGSMRLQLQPAGPVSSQLPGVAAAFGAAAQAVADTGRAFRGEMDLALELAMMQSLQEHRQRQQRQRGADAHEGYSWALGPLDGVAAAAQVQKVEGGMEDSGRSARATTSSSFDIDEMLKWSHTNM